MENIDFFYVAAVISFYFCLSEETVVVLVIFGFHKKWPFKMYFLEGYHLNYILSQMEGLTINYLGLSVPSFQLL